MALELNGTTGVSAVQNGAVTAADLTSTLDLTGKTVTLPNGTIGSGDLPAGSVIQVVQDTEDAQVQTSVVNGTYHDSGLLATITPSSSSNKILVIASVFIRSRPDNGSQFVFPRLLRNGVTIASSFFEDIEFERSGKDVTFCYLDNPSTTSSVSYTFEVAANGGTNLQINPDNGTTNQSTITLMEIAG